MKIFGPAILLCLVMLLGLVGGAYLYARHVASAASAVYNQYDRDSGIPCQTH
jgi:hypothetical protein